MPSLADIPDDILENEDPTALTNWILTLPITKPIGRRLISLWERATGRKVSAHQRTLVDEALQD